MLDTLTDPGNRFEYEDEEEDPNDEGNKARSRKKSVRFVREPEQVLRNTDGFE